MCECSTLFCSVLPQPPGGRRRRWVRSRSRTRRGRRRRWVGVAAGMGKLDVGRSWSGAPRIYSSWHGHHGRNEWLME